METGKLYYEDCHLARFSARVLRCEEGKEGFRVVLDATAFYPEGGGQPGDTGVLGGVAVLDTREEGGEIVHLCRETLIVGETVEGIIDYDRRFGFMQQHTGEHMVSGILHRRFGLHNTGFHIGAEGVTVDFDGHRAEYTPDMMNQLEPAYAITVHKAQGSEYRAVILSAVEAAPMLLTRGVLYTAMTRAKELLILVGDDQVVARMAANDRQQRRYSGLRARLAKG